LVPISCFTRWPAYGFIPIIAHVPALIFLGIWFAAQLASATFSVLSEPGVAVWAHVGGFLYRHAAHALLSAELDQVTSAALLKSVPDRVPKRSVGMKKSVQVEQHRKMTAPQLAASRSSS
jgi:hypothetical protein